MFGECTRSEPYSLYIYICFVCFLGFRRFGAFSGLPSSLSGRPVETGLTTEPLPPLPPLPPFARFVRFVRRFGHRSPGRSEPPPGRIRSGRVLSRFWGTPRERGVRGVARRSLIRSPRSVAACSSSRGFWVRTPKATRQELVQEVETPSCEFLRQL